MHQAPHVPAEPPISTFRVRILGGNNAPAQPRDIWRDIQIAANQRLFDLGEAIPLAFAFEVARPWSFVLHGPRADSTEAYRFAPRLDRPFFVADHAYDPARISLRDLPLPGATGRREFFLRFEDGSWVFGARLVDVSPMAEAHLRYPRVARLHGEAPPQFPEAAAGVTVTLPRVADEALSHH